MQRGQPLDRGPRIKSRAELLILPWAPGLAGLFGQGLFPLLTPFGFFQSVGSARHGLKNFGVSVRTFLRKVMPGDRINALGKIGDEGQRFRCGHGSSRASQIPAVESSNKSCSSRKAASSRSGWGDGSSGPKARPPTDTQRGRVTASSGSPPARFHWWLLPPRPRSSG